MEMHLIPESPQSVYVGDLELRVEVSPGESIWTESSYKFTKESTQCMLTHLRVSLVLKEILELFQSLHRRQCLRRLML